MTNEKVQKLHDDMSKLIDEIKQERDEILLKVHLGKAEIRDEWEKVEEKWQNLKHKAEQVGHEAKEVSKDVAAATNLLGKEIKEGYQRIRKSL